MMPRGRWRRLRRVRAREAAGDAETEGVEGGPQCKGAAALKRLADEETRLTAAVEKCG